MDPFRRVSRVFTHLQRLRTDENFSWDGDGFCDILAVDRSTGNVRMWRNQGVDRTSEKPTFATAVTVVSGGLCPQSWSPNPTDLAVRFGDLDADGRVDYICMDPNGRSRGWLNTGSGLKAMDPNQIKVSVGFDRANHRWADVNGDGGKKSTFSAFRVQ